MNRLNNYIYHALTTKVGKQNESTELVKELGFELCDNLNSAQGYYEIKNPKTSRTLVISKDRNNKLGIFNPYDAIVRGRENIEKVDFYGYLTKQKSAYKSFDPLGYTKTNRYKMERAKEGIKEAEKYIKRYKEEIEEVKAKYEKEIERINERIKYEEKAMQRSKDKLEEIRKSIRKAV